MKKLKYVTGWKKPKRERKHVTGRKCWCRTKRIKPWPKRERVLFRGWAADSVGCEGGNARIVWERRPVIGRWPKVVRVKVVVE